MARLGIALLALVGCSEANDRRGGAPAPAPPEPVATAPAAAAEPAADDASPAARADVVAVSVDGEPGAYRFAVGVRSSDTGCERYASWWEVLTPEGQLLARRVLRHSHVDEQPFTRTHGPVRIEPTTEVIVRAHMQPGGYGGQAMRGAPATGFAPATELDARFAPALADEPPQPPPCAF